MKKINVLVVDDEPMFREPFCSKLEQQTFIKVVYQAHDELSFLHQLNNHTIDLVLLDIKLQNISGVELFRKLCNHDQRPLVIALTSVPGKAAMIALLQMGIDGIVRKMNFFSEIVTAIEQVLDSGDYFTEDIRQIIKEYRHRWNNLPPVLLSFMEMEVLKALANGATTAKIAALTKMTHSSAKKFKQRLMNKIGVKNSAALISYAYHNGILI
jgi:DNA-binding NarL/FixJ family response regulator